MPDTTTESRFITLTIDRLEMAARGRAGAAVVHAKHDGATLTKNARAAFDRRFVALADPQNELSAEEREQRVAQLRREYFRALGRASAQARRENRAPP